jgi:uncharacterized membrane protein
MAQRMTMLLAGVVYLLWVGWLVYMYPQLPAEIPTHFNARGVADGWGPRAVLISIPVVALFTSGVLLALAFSTSGLINYPVKLTEDNRDRQQRLMRHFLTVLAYIVLTLMIYISVAMVRGAHAPADSGYQAGGFWFFLAALLLWIGWYFWQSRQLR